ncbi:hypothetical protein EON63_08825 [archaeon]|nr:MAG: hypothetical protein EON63_08825 [archaeon]
MMPCHTHTIPISYTYPYHTHIVHNLLFVVCNVVSTYPFDVFQTWHGIHTSLSCNTPYHTS